MNDGRSLDMIEDGSVDFAFSFDSLVHADAEVIAGYLRELERKLAPEGVGFVHHSNAGRYRRYFELADSIPRGPLRERLYELRVLDRPRWRALDMTAGRFRRSCEAGGSSLRQPGDRELDDQTADRLLLGDRETNVSLGPPEPRVGEPRVRRRGQSGETASGAVLARPTLRWGQASA